MDSDPRSLGETARSISKARMIVKSRTLVLIVHSQREFKKNIRITNANRYDQGEKKTHSTSENRKPIQALGPPMNVNRFAQTPGTEEAAFGISAQRSGLGEKNRSEEQIKTKL